MKHTLYVHLTTGRGVEVRGAEAFTIEEDALFVWSREIDDDLNQGHGGHLLAVFAPRNWTHAEWLGQ